MYATKRIRICAIVVSRRFFIGLFTSLAFKLYSMSTARFLFE